ncbi:hypothetical protein NEOLEDRAFT_556226 [Neolentinus lepideus HHB14362 ss-1]|uniref:Uncharacterized protein n=1 Tax=Neolentinus lepideus HHB14362 ss-1 TaxID=1314782 RepID=A0A165R596_9AGAM|nr:hypothetical protein NEOLEDRAFT_556226 [Neolentinus lepideus HHB14362 ss-1]
MLMVLAFLVKRSEKSRAERRSQISSSCIALSFTLLLSTLQTPSLLPEVGHDASLPRTLLSYAIGRSWLSAHHCNASPCVPSKWIALYQNVSITLIGMSCT